MTSNRLTTLNKFVASCASVFSKCSVVTTAVFLITAYQPVYAASLITDPDKWVVVDTPRDPLLKDLNIPANAASQGMWSPVYDWPMNGLHNMVLPDGKVLTFGTSADGLAQNGRLFDVWDPLLGFGPESHNSSFQEEQQDTFCTAATYLNDGNLLITGGNTRVGGFGNGSTIFNPVNNTRFTSTATTALPRWYASMITLPDSRKLIMGGMKPYTEGMWRSPDQAIAKGEPSMTPEIYENGQWRSLFGAYSRDAFGPDFLRTSYPRAFVAPNGQVFGISSDKMWYLDPNANDGIGGISYVGDFKQGYGNSTDPVNVGPLSVAVMYDVGKIIQVGGNGGNNGDGFAASNMATVFDITDGLPKLAEQSRMRYARRYGNGVVLANGQVVVTGGTTLGNFNASERPEGSEAVFAAEIWDPATGSWSLGAEARTIRVYHSITSLLTNGTVLSTGGGTPGPVLNLNAEVYYPPYLFESDGVESTLAERPVIAAISGLKYSENAPLQLDMVTSDAISGLALVGLSNGTHSFNSGQRRIPLEFAQDDVRITATMPSANVAPPGYYQVVVLNTRGVPSLGVIVAIGTDLESPNIPTVPYSPPLIIPTISVPKISAGEPGVYTIDTISGYQYSWRFGDGSGATPYSDNPRAEHTYTEPGAYVVTLSVKDSADIVSTKTFMQAVSTGQTPNKPSSSTPIALGKQNEGMTNLWVVNPDNNSVSILDGNNGQLLREVAVGRSPRSVAIAPDGRAWVSNKHSATLSILSPSTLSVVQAVALPRASQPHGLVFAPDGSAAYVTLEATGELLKLDVNSGTVISRVSLGNNIRGIAVTADSAVILVSRFITPPLPGESTLSIDTSKKGGEVFVVSAEDMTISHTITLKHSDKIDNEIQGAGVPNYLAAPVIAPDGTTAWVPSKQDNIKRGVARSGQNLDFQNTVRAISSQINMESMTETYARRVDLDDSSVGSAGIYHGNGVYLFVALETSREVAVVDAINGHELFRIDTGFAPQGLAISEDGNTLFVQEFMSRTVRGIDLSPLLLEGTLSVDKKFLTSTIVAEKLASNVLNGKRMFYDAKDPRLARDSYMSCASCHNDAGQDGRVWDLSGFGEGLRNTIALNGRAAMGNGFLHWSANFDELQDFEQQIRDLAGGSGLMADTDFFFGTRRLPLGDKKAGVSQPLDDLTAYLTSLSLFAPAPERSDDGELSFDAMAGKAVFDKACSYCHGGINYTFSADGGAVENVGTVNHASGKRLDSVLTGIDIPTLRDVWATAPYLHNGSAATISDAILSHVNTSLSVTDLANVSAYVRQVGSEESGLPGELDNLALSAKLATSNVSPWETLGAVNNNSTHASSADKNGSAYGNWRGISGYGQTDWVSFSWENEKVISAFEVYWWDDGLGISKPNDAVVEYWNGNSWVSLSPVGTELNLFNRIQFGPVLTRSIRISMSSIRSTGILEARVWGVDGYELTANVSPTVSLVSPVENSVFTEGEVITLSANAADIDGSIVSVLFYDGGELLFKDDTAPYAYTWTDAVSGMHTLSASAVDDGGLSSNSENVSIRVNPKTVVESTNLALDATLDTSYVSRFNSLNAVNNNTSHVDSSDKNGGAYGNWRGVAFYGEIDWVSFSWDSNKTIDAFEVYWWDNGFGTGRPNSAVVEYWDGSDWMNLGEVGVSLNQFNRIELGAVSTSSIRVAMVGDLSTGILEARVWGREGVIPAVNELPSVSLTAPSANTVFKVGESILITADAKDSDGTIANVNFYNGSTLLGSDDTAPYMYMWDGAEQGEYRLSAQVIDDAGSTVFGVPVDVTVNEIPSSLSSIQVLNSSFEDVVLQNGAIGAMSSNWTGGTGVFNPSVFWYSTLAGVNNTGSMTGNNAAYFYGGEPSQPLQQTVGHRVIANNTYSLTIAIGGRTSNEAFAGGTLELIANGEVVSSETITTMPVAGTFSDVSTTWIAPPSYAGAALTIRINSISKAAGSYLDIDNVRLVRVGENSLPKLSDTLSADCSLKQEMPGSDIILLIGQSNMSGYGRGWNAEIDAFENPRINQWSRAQTVVAGVEPLQHADWKVGQERVGMGVSFARQYLATLPAQRDVLLVPAAYGGTGLQNGAGPWTPGVNAPFLPYSNSGLFDEAVSRLTNALDSNAGNCVAAILWHQGESDVGNTNYQANLDNMINTLRSIQPRAAQSPFILGQFVPEWINTRNSQAIRDTLAVINTTPSRLPYTAVAPSSGLGFNSGDIIHFDAQALREYGVRYFQALPSALANTGI